MALTTIEAGALDIAFGWLTDTSVELTDAAGRALVKNEIGRRLTIRMLKPFADSPASWAIVRWSIKRGTPAVTGYCRRKIESSAFIPADLRDVVADAFDDFVERVVAENLERLDQAAIERIVNEHFHYTSPTAVSATVNHGATMSTTPRPLGPPDDFSLAEFQQMLSVQGKLRWASFNRNYLTAAAPGTSTVDEPASPREINRAVTIAIWRDEAQMLAILDDSTVDDETAIWGFVGTATRYVGDGETRREDQIGDAVDALTTGATRETVRNGVNAIATNLVWATPRLAVVIAVVIVVSFAVASCFVIVGIGFAYQGLHPEEPNLDKLIQASFCIIGAGVALLPIALIHGYVGEKWDKLIIAATGPFSWAANILKAYAKSRGLPIETTDHPAA